MSFRDVFLTDSCNLLRYLFQFTRINDFVSLTSCNKKMREFFRSDSNIINGFMDSIVFVDGCTRKNKKCVASKYLLKGVDAFIIATDEQAQEYGCHSKQAAYWYRGKTLFMKYSYPHKGRFCPLCNMVRLSNMKKLGIPGTIMTEDWSEEGYELLKKICNQSEKNDKRNKERKHKVETNFLSSLAYFS